MPTFPDWKCEEDVCKIKVEDLTAAARFKKKQDLYKMGEPETKKEAGEKKMMEWVIDNIDSGGHVRELEDRLSSISEDITLSELGDDGDRFFYEIKSPNDPRILKTVEREVKKVKYAQGAKEVKKTEMLGGDPHSRATIVEDDLRTAFKPAIKFTCHKIDDDWDQERIERLTPASTEDPSPYSHLPNLKNSLVVVHTVALGEQWKESVGSELFLNIPQEEIGFIGGGKADLCPVTITTYQSLTRPYIQDALKGKVGMLVIDETHHGSADEWNRGIKGLDVDKWKIETALDEDKGQLKEVVVPDKYLPPEKRPLKLGLSATPAPFGPEKERLLSEAIGEKLTSVRDSDIVKAGFILPVRMRRKKIEPRPFNKAIHDSALIINTDAKAHINDIKAARWNRNLGDIRNIHLYKMKDEDAKREYRAAFNASGVMFDATASDENKMKEAIERIAESPSESFIVYSPRVLPLYFISRALQASNIDPPGCRVRLGEEIEADVCKADTKEECKRIARGEEGEHPCVWSEGTLPFVGKASRDIAKRKNVYEEMKKTIAEAKEEEKAGILINFISQQFDTLRDKGVEIDEKRRIVEDLFERKCIPNIGEGITFSEDLYDRCKEEDQCGSERARVNGAEVSLCAEGRIVDPRLGVFPKKARRSIDIARSKLERVKGILQAVKVGIKHENSAQWELERIGLEKDANILKSLSDKIGGQAALKKEMAEVMTGSFISELLWRNLDEITIHYSTPFEDYAKVGRIHYGNLINWEERKRIPITKTHIPGALYPFPTMFGIFWGIRPVGYPSTDPKLRSLLSSIRYILSTNMRNAVNKDEFELANFFKGQAVTSNVLRDFSEGKSRVLATTYKEGIDIPSANNLIIASVYTKPKDIIQLSGRIKRIADGKEPGETLFLTSRGTIDERYFRSAMRNLITDVHHTEYGRELKEELKLIPNASEG